MLQLSSKVPARIRSNPPQSGYLTLGKLTARVEKKGSGVRGQGSDIGAKASSFILHPSSLFSVRTPTAIVTDLGTEFGVEVDQEGGTTSSVFRGRVKVQTVGDGQSNNIVLRANESARVEMDKKTGRPLIVTGVAIGAAPEFARRLYEPPKFLDLLDVVAGGNGTGKARGCGIDPLSGNRQFELLDDWRHGYGDYRRVRWNSLIDGVFVPVDSLEPVQLDSAGHTFDGFPSISGATGGPVWTRGAEVMPEQYAHGWIYDIGPSRQFMPEGRGLMSLPPNKGLTFDLEAARKIFPEVRPARFRAVAGLGDYLAAHPDAKGENGMADVWVFVDGRLKFKRLKLLPQDGPFPINLELGPKDRFLTLVSTDAGNTIARDCVVFGDPVLDMAPIGNPRSTTEGAKRKENSKGANRNGANVSE